MIEQLAIWAGTMAAAWFVLRWWTWRCYLAAGIMDNNLATARPSRRPAFQPNKPGDQLSQAGINGPEPSLSKPVDGPRRAIPYASPPATRPLEYFYGADSVTTAAPCG